MAEIAAEATNAKSGRSSALRLQVTAPVRSQLATRTTANTITSSLPSKSFGKTNSETAVGKNESGIRKAATVRIQRARGEALLVWTTCVRAVSDATSMVIDHRPTRAKETTKRSQRVGLIRTRTVAAAAVIVVLVIAGRVVVMLLRRLAFTAAIAIFVLTSRLVEAVGKERNHGVLY
jgi:hypothetical protein